MKLAYKIIALIVVSGLVLIAIAAYALGVMSYERHSGYFTPVWDDTGKNIYFIQRDTSGFIWGTGWEHFTPPASSYLTSDEFSLRRLDVETGTVDILQFWSDSPLMKRVTKHYRGRIFNTSSARIDLTEDSVKFVVQLQIPKPPRSEMWTLAGTWHERMPATASWQQEWSSPGGVNDGVLRNGIEVLTVRGRESFPAAIVLVSETSDYKIALSNDDFAKVYPDGIPQKTIDERSRRSSIERSRKYKKVRRNLIAKHMAAGLREGEAMLRATEDMEELGLIAKRPRLVAKVVSTIPDDLKAFDIPPGYFAAGLFDDISKAIAEPGKLVDTNTGGYLKYYDDDVGVRLKAWRNAGNDRFAVRTDGKIYLLEVRRFK